MLLPGQKAPSAKRCIKTPSRDRSWRHRMCVRKHRAPKGALRLGELVRDHRQAVLVRKHRAPKGALRLMRFSVFIVVLALSESTERQKVH